MMIHDLTLEQNTMSIADIAPARRIDRILRCWMSITHYFTIEYYRAHLAYCTTKLYRVFVAIDLC
jgi:hypothetical protein